ncbi:MAG: hypothetical protein JXR71_05200 [Bacteroidales bacterium]|nr:hypothetical protein [Bacteroidales bacterium]
MKSFGIHRLVLFLILLGSVQAMGQAMAESSKLPDVKPDNKIIIRGSSNLSTFTLSLQFRKDSLNNIADTSQCAATSDSVLILPVADFSYSNPLMKKDLYHLIDADQYPFIKIYYPPEMLNRSTTGKLHQFELVVQIRNMCRTYKVPVNYNKHSKNTFEAEGSLNVKLSDFQLKPKKYFFGLVKLKNNLKIDFYLYF